ncbi:MAG TPA: hypothetical protein DD417_02945 [Elusimicrobia bacterium]|nr:hypothetical protein [Elusimicrobiota bacterium]
MIRPYLGYESEAGQSRPGGVGGMADDILLAEFVRHLRVERGLSRKTWLSYGYQLRGYLAFLAARGKGPLSAGRDDVLAYLERRKDDGLKSASLFIAAMAIRQFHRFLADTARAGSDSRDAGAHVCHWDAGFGVGRPQRGGPQPTRGLGTDLGQVWPGRVIFCALAQDSPAWRNDRRTAR